MEKLFLPLSIIIGILLIVGIIYLTLPEIDKNKLISATGETKEFDLELFNWDFQPAVFKVKAGDKVKFRIKTRDVSHGLGIDEFKINKRVDPNQMVEVEFLADKRGEFRMYCSVPCGEGHLEMAGKLIVE